MSRATSRSWRSAPATSTRCTACSARWHRGLRVHEPSGTGRVRLYEENGPRSTQHARGVDALWQPDDLRSTTCLFECVGSRQPKQAADQARVINYANAGWRVFATHFSYVWLTNSDGSNGSNTAPTPFSRLPTGRRTGQLQFRDRDHRSGRAGRSGDAGRRVAFANWLQYVNASTTLGQIPVNVVRNDLTP